MLIKGKRTEKDMSATEREFILVNEDKEGYE